MNGNTRHRIAKFPYLRVALPGDRYVNRSIMQFKPDGGNRIRHMSFLKAVKPDEWWAELNKMERCED